MSFSSDLNRIIKKTKANADLVVAKVTGDIFRDLILPTPVDQGIAKGNWQPGVDSYNTGYSLDTADKNGGATLTKAAAVADATGAGHIVYLVNNLPYIRALEYGHSQQAPAGWVRTAVAQYKKYIENAARSLK